MSSPTANPCPPDGRPAPGPCPRPGPALALALALAWSLAAAPPQARAQPRAAGALDTSGPISISADHMTADDSRRLVTFTGKVVARQGDLVISCDAMNVSYQPAGSYAPPAAREEGAGIPDAAQAPAADVQDGGRHLPEGASAPAAGRSPLSGGQEIDRVECEGAVKIQQGDRLAVARKALYLAKALPRRLILTGEARVWQGASSVTGHQITYYLDENRSLVDSQGSRRVRAFYEQGGSR